MCIPWWTVRACWPYHCSHDSSGGTCRVASGDGARTIGRGDDCDLVIHARLASRKHFSIRLLRTHFYLLDHSLNGTFVTLESGEEVHVLRGELLLDGAGSIALGQSVREGAADIISYARDRRSMYRK